MHAQGEQGPAECDSVAKMGGAQMAFAATEPILVYDASQLTPLAQPDAVS